MTDDAGTAGLATDVLSTTRAVEVVTGKRRRARYWTHLFLIAISVLWIFPLAWTIYTSLRPYGETARLGYVSIGGTYNLDNFGRAIQGMELWQHLFNTLVVVVPALVLVLWFASMLAFAVSRYSFRFNVALLMLFTAGNLLPQQIVITPLFRLYLALPLPKVLNEFGLWYDSYFGIVMIHIAFQLGFCTFVLANYFRQIPRELSEAAVMDGASVWRTYRSVLLPLARPALAALATLEFTWIYNDFFWGILLLRTGDKFPITSALNNLSGQFFTDNNLLAAGALLVALPTLIVYFALQKQFVAGLTLGSTKG
ncbi:MAG TPA: carbohydrate ABC transporter permease [Candidatus Limnocylindrales bacterium]|jgi:multiple sugar transport system permease protein|nr:carbohydrate ABC transporter permease [Candidatus Limnocylindrales bacterium]